MEGCLQKAGFHLTVSNGNSPTFRFSSCLCVEDTSTWNMTGTLEQFCLGVFTIQESEKWGDLLQVVARVDSIR
jgi:hypothetical protein